MPKNLTHNQKPAGRPPKKIVDAKGPVDFPAIGKTLSTYQPNFTNKPAEAPKKHLTRRKVIKRAALVVGALIILAGGWLGFKFYKDFGGWSGIWGLFHSTHLKGEDVGRVNILLVGYSADDPGHSGADLTDSIMLVSIDTRDNTAYTMSIPRDLYVNIPNFGYSKINAAYEDGQSEHFTAAGYPDGGMGLLEQVVNQDFNVPIDYYALIDYTAFRDSVNAVGGINVNINSPDGELYDPSIDYATNGPLVNLKNGVHTLNGEQALDLARARGDAYGSIGFEQSDFQRTADQRLMLVALKNKALSISVLSNPVKLGNLFDSIGKNVKTDLTVSDIRRLYTLGKKIDSSKIKSISLNDVNGKDYLQSYEASDGESALIPAAGLDDYSAIQAYVQQISVVSANSK